MFTSARSDFVLEHWFASLVPPTYCGVRSLDWMYVKYETGEEELYDERADPYELTNLASDPNSAAQLDLMRQRAQTLCTGGSYYPVPWPFA